MFSGIRRFFHTPALGAQPQLEGEQRWRSGSRFIHTVMCVAEHIDPLSPDKLNVALQRKFDELGADTDLCLMSRARSEVSNHRQAKAVRLKAWRKI